MLFIAVSLPLLALVFTGVGLLFYRPQTGGENGESHPPAGRPGLFESLLVAFWVGWAVVIAALQVWHLFFPVNALLLGFTCGAGAAGWYGARRTFAETGLRRLLTSAGLALGGLALLPALALGSHVFFVPPHFDHGLYHMQSVQWIETYAIVPGLANLHHRLAFNNANFLYAALLNNGPLDGRAYFLSNTLLGYVLLLQCAAGFYGLFRQGERLTAARLYFALMLPGALWHLSTTHLPGYSPDVVVFALQVVMGGLLLDLIETAGDRRGFDRRAAVIVLLAATGVAVKLSSAVFSLLALLGVAAAWWLRFRPARGEAVRRLAAWGGLAALLVVPWMARSVLLSGYPLFPSAALPLPVPWRTPAELVTPISPIILNWARTVNSTIPYTGDLAWLRAWYAAFPFDVVKRAFLLAAGVLALDLLLAAALVLRRSGPGARFSALFCDLRVTAAGALAVLSGIGLLAWFLMAPDYRFSGGLFWMFLTAGLALGFFLLDSAGMLGEPLRLAAALIVGLAILISPNHFEIHKPGNQLWLPQPEAEWVAQFEPDGPRTARETRSGLTVYLAEEASGQCFSQPLPCTRVQDFDGGLSLFEPGNLQRGFYIQP